MNVDVSLAGRLGADGVDEPLLDLMRTAVTEVLRRQGADPAAEVSIYLTDDDDLAEMNRRYRGVDGPTDVLSFGLGAAPEGPGQPVLLGDVVISVARGRAQAEQYGHDLARELCYLACHGALHLLGWDDLEPQQAAAMHAEADAVLAGMGLGR